MAITLIPASAEEADFPSLDAPFPVRIALSCNRETWRLIRLARTFSRALCAAHDGGESKRFSEALLSLHDHKGGLTAEWRTMRDAVDLARHVERAWEAENECRENCTHLVDGEECDTAAAKAGAA